MSKPAAIFVAAAMAVTAVCVAVIAGVGLGLSVAGSALAGLASLALMAVTHLAFMRAAPQDDGRYEDLDRVVNELQSRLETIEVRLSTIEGAAADRARAATKPLVEEIAALGGLVTSVAKEVAAHDGAIARLKSEALERRAVEPPPPAPVAPPPAAFEPAPWVAEPEPRTQVAKIRAPEPFDPAEFAPAPPRDLASRLAAALVQDRIEPHLQPIVTLPSRRVSHYEALARMVEADGLVPAADFVDEATASLPAIDRRIVERCAEVALRVSARGGGGAVFVNLAPQTLRDATTRDAIAGLIERRKELARLFVFELRASVFRSLGAVEKKALAGFAEQGVRLSLDDVPDLRLDARELAGLGVRFVKIPSPLLLDPEAVRGAAIHPADLAGLLARHNIDLIASHVEEERTVPELLDMELRFAQGNLFGVPRPVRPVGEASADAPASTPAARLVPRSVASR